MDWLFIFLHQKLLLVQEAHRDYQNWGNEVEVVPNVFPVLHEALTDLNEFLTQEVKREDSKNNVEDCNGFVGLFLESLIFLVNGSLEDVVEVGYKNNLIGQEREEVSFECVLESKRVLEVNQVLDHLLLKHLEVINV